MRPRRLQSRSYGKETAPVQRLAQFAAVVLVCLGLATSAGIAAEPPVTIVAFGDSLTAGYGLPVEAAFAARLEQALKARGHDVTVINAGVSGDTASGGLGRVDWSVPDGADAVILELGANDALRGVDPAVTKAALDKILTRFAERKIPVLLAGMRAPRNMGSDYVGAFDAIYPALAAAYGPVFHPFFLEGVATDPSLNQADGIHPNAAGVDAIVRNILPKVEELMARAKSARSP